MHQKLIGPGRGILTQVSWAEPPVTEHLSSVARAESVSVEAKLFLTDELEPCGAVGRSEFEFAGLVFHASDGGEGIEKAGFERHGIGWKDRKSVV